jgi:P27 family predicted phage terminase small subunit
MPAPKVVPIATGREIPPAHLGDAGRALWRSIQRDHEIADGAGLALLARACECADRLAAVREQVAKDGLLVPGYKRQPRPHPLLSVEAEAIRLQLAALRALGLEPEQ